MVAVLPLIACVCRPDRAATPREPADQAKGPADPSPPRAVKEDDAASLRTTPETLDLDGVRFVIVPYLWQNFMPVTQPGDHPMLASIKLKTARGEPMPAGVSLGRVWLLDNASPRLWSGAFLDEERRDTPDVLEKMFREGPVWPTGLTVDVIVEVKTPGGQVHRLRASKVEVHQVS